MTADAPAGPAPLPTYDLLAPHTGRRVRTLPEHDGRAVNQAVDRSRAVQRQYARRTPAERAQVLLDLAERIESSASLLAGEEVATTGKLHRDVVDTEIPHVVDVLRYFAGAARTQTGVPAGQYIDDHHSYVLHEPIGVVGAILPWNYPLMMLAWKLGPALAAGCTVVAKPAENTPLTALTVRTILDQTSDLRGLLEVVTGGAATGSALAVADLDLLAFTGSIRTGRTVAAAAAQRGTPVHLELGGNCPVIVLPDADLPDMATRLAGAATFNSGQSCAAPSRVIVVGDSARLTDVTQALADALDRQRPGMPDDRDASYGAMASREQVDRLALLTGLQHEGHGCHVRPFIVAAEPGDVAFDEELFGPGLTITAARTVAEAVHLAGHGGWGLAASVWGRDHDALTRAAAALPFGEVWINTHLAQTPELPHSGFNASGHGSDMSLYSLAAYQRVKTVTARLRNA